MLRARFQTQLLREGDDIHWWTWAGSRASATLIEALPAIADVQRPDNFRIRLNGVEAVENLSDELSRVLWGDLRPDVSDAALKGLKFAEVLPPDLAVATIAERLTDLDGARVVAAEARIWVTTG
jgi:ATP-dependent helicase Lhr and Lhr-like helicase